MRIIYTKPAGLVYEFDKCPLRETVRCVSALKEDEAA